MNRALPRATVRSAVYLAFALCMITTAVNLQAPLYDALAARCLLYTSPSPQDKRQSRMPSSA